MEEVLAQPEGEYIQYHNRGTIGKAIYFIQFIIYICIHFIVKCLLYIYAWRKFTAIKMQINQDRKI